MRMICQLNFFLTSTPSPRKQNFRILLVMVRVSLHDLSIHATWVVDVLPIKID